VKIPLPLTLYVLLIIILASWILIFGFLGIIRWEQYCATGGMSFSSFDRERRMLRIWILSALSVITAILLASGTPLLSPSVITGFFLWVGQLVQWLFGLLFWAVGLFFRFILELIFGGDETEPIDIDPFRQSPSPSLPAEPESDPSPIGEWLKYGALVLLAAGFVWFMISPLLKRNRGLQGNYFQKLRRTIVEWFKALFAGFASFFAFFKSGKASQKLRRPGADEIRQAAKTILGAYSQARKTDVRRSVTLFARLIIWGGEVRHVMWRPVYAPAEYCRFLAAAAAEPPEDTAILPERNEGIIRCGELFEQALYSAQPLSDAEQKEFKGLVEEITGA
jgi:hypothetical protein